MSKHRAFEYLRLTSLGVIGALVKVDDPEVVRFLLQTEIVPLCLRIMESGSELSKTVATFIVQKILLDDVGLAYLCATAERFYAVCIPLTITTITTFLALAAFSFYTNFDVSFHSFFFCVYCFNFTKKVSTVLASMVSRLTENPSVRLLKHVVRCYLRLSEQQKSRNALKKCLPGALRDLTFATILKSEETVQKWLHQLVRNCSENDVGISQITQQQTNYIVGSMNALSGNIGFSTINNNVGFSTVNNHNISSSSNNSDNYGRISYINR